MNKQFIKATEKACSFDEYIASPYLRKSFELDFVPEKAELSICGLGFYVLCINGKEITKGALAPYISNPDDYCYYDTYDVKSMLVEGENVIGIMLGNGMFNAFSGVVWDFQKAEWLGAPRMSLEFIAEGDNKKLEFIADESFKVHPSPVIFDDLRMGEYYDANLEIEGWNKAGFDDSAWDNAMKAETPRGELKLCTAEPIKVMYEIKPVSVKKQTGGYLYDFGINTAGVCRLKINAKKGQKITFWHAELLKDGELDFSSTIFDGPDVQFYKEYSQKDIYIAKGEGEEIYIPKFTYHGFRYVFVEGIEEEQATDDLLTYLVMNSDLKRIGGFECSDEVSNTLFEMVKRSDLANFYYFPTDCPHREKNGWTGDAAVSAERMVLLYDVEKSWREWLGNIRKAQNDRGELPGIVPTTGWGYNAWNGPSWDTVIFNLPYELYKKRGNVEAIKENAHAMVRYLEYILTRRSENGTIAVGLGDWVPVGRHPSDYVSPLALTDSIMVMEMARKASEMFDAVGYKHSKAFADSIYADMYETIRRELVDFSTMTAAGECQTSQAMALYYGLFKENEEQKAFEKLLNLVHRNDDKFDCGFLGMRVIFHVLAEFGEAELAYDMITRKEYPSYGYWIETGETTLCEAFQPTVKCGSHNHHFLGDIGNWYISAVAGLRIVNSEKVLISPNFINQLDYASAYHDLPKGRVSVSWKRVGDEIELEVKCPVEYEIKIPPKYASLKISNK